jgi:Reverse transcriptase (RNA-dependent DNA polymerase)
MAIRAKNRIRKQYQKGHDPNTKKQLNTMTQEIRQMIKKHRNESWTKKVESLQVKDKSLWQMTKTIMRLPTKVPPLHGKRGMAYSNIDKANALADTLEETFTPHDDICDIDNIELVEYTIEDLESRHTPNEDLELASPNEVSRIIRKLKNGKSPGLDGISNKVYKHLPRKAIVYLTKIFNTMIKLQHFSTKLKKSKIILFPKPGKDHTFPQNYRPISLLNVISKIFEQILLTRLQSHIESSNIMNPEQCGFRKQHSTNHQLLRLTEQITKGFNTNKATGIVFLDIAQAFDRVWHDGLIYKLMDYDFPPYLIKLVKSYLKDRTFEVHHNNSISTTRVIEAGVPQGSIIGPTLFNLYINDLPKTQNVQTALYADDTALITQSWSGQQASKNLQTALNNLETYYENWRIKINVTKSDAVLFSRRKKKERLKTNSLTLFDEKIKWSKEAKYLGVTMDQKLNWGTHINTVANKANKRIGILSPLLNRRSNLSQSNSLLLYRSMIRPIMTYAAPIWGTARKVHIKKLQTIQNKVTRMITKSPWYIRNVDIHDDLNLLTMSSTIKQQADKFFKDLPKIPNSLICNLGDYDIFENFKHARPKQILLS